MPDPSLQTPSGNADGLGATCIGPDGLGADGLGADGFGRNGNGNANDTDSTGDLSAGIRGIGIGAGVGGRGGLDARGGGMNGRGGSMDDGSVVAPLSLEGMAGCVGGAAGAGGAGGAGGKGGVTFMDMNGGMGGAGGFGGIGGQGSFSLPAVLPTHMLDLSMSPKSVLSIASGGFVANIAHQGDWLFDIGAKTGGAGEAEGSRKGSPDWEALRRRERELEMKWFATHPGFSKLSDEPVDVSHVKSKVECGRHVSKRKPRRKKKRIKVPTFESQLELVNQGDGDLLCTRKVQSMRMPSRLPPIETRESVSSSTNSQAQGTRASPRMVAH